MSQFCEQLFRGGGLRIAILEDDVHVGQLICLWLEDVGHDCQLFGSGAAFYTAIARDSFDLLVLDWMLPDTSGDVVLAWVRQHIDWPMPVIFVTRRDSEEDIVHGLNQGADDYIVKPVRQKELLARIGAVMRRSQKAAEVEGLLAVPPYQFHLTNRRVSCRNKEIELTQKEYELVLFLFRNAGRMLSRGHILESVWGQSADLNTRTVDTHVSRVRTKLELNAENGWRLSSIYHYGYRLERVN